MRALTVFDPVPATSPTPQAASDDQLVALWLHGRPENTQRAYEREAEAFFASVGKPLQAITLGDCQRFVDTLAHLAPATQARSINAVKSLFHFAQRLGYLSFNVAAALRVPTVKNVLAERIIDEPDVHRMLALEPDDRNRGLFRLLYAGGLRVSELAGLSWRDVQPRDDAGQVTILGKGGKTRAILLSATTWRELAAGRNGVNLDDPVFPSKRTGHHLSASAIWRIVRAAAVRAGITLAVSPHWLRHAHASHALDRGAPIHLVQATLGHASVATTGKYLHARPNDSSARYLAV